MIDLVREEEIPLAPAQVLVKVTNRNPFVIKDRFDGVPVLFKPNETVTLTREQALHFFGYPGDRMDMAVHMAKRFGWNTLAYTHVDPMDGPDGPTLYQKQAWLIEFHEQEFKLVPVGDHADDGLNVESMPVGKAPPTPDDEPTRPTRSGQGKHFKQRGHRIRARSKPRKDKGQPRVPQTVEPAVALEE